MYYDVGDRTTVSVSVGTNGTNGGTVWTRPSSVPARSDAALVSSVSYDSAGRSFETTDPKGLKARTYYDALGRSTKTIANYVDGTVSDTDDKTTEYTYGFAGMTSLTAKLTGGGGQTTEWVYGVSTATGSGINSNDVIGKTKWPDPSTGSSSISQQDTVLVNALGQPLITTDRNGNSHTLSYDILGRVVSDAITTLGSGVDGSVRRVESAYDSQGNAYLLTNYDAASGGNIVTQVQRQFNGLGQLTREWQSHSGTVNTSTTPSVQYAYSEMAGGANHSRITSMTYPSGYVVTYNYTTGLNGSISRLSSLSDSTGTLESYDYLGLGTVVRRSHPQPDVDLTFLGTGPGSGGDQYVGLDSFGRVIDQNWKKGSTSTDRFTYSYDRDGNRLTKGNSVNTAFNESYSYDNLNQLSNFTRGSHTQSWDFDALGNWNSVTTDGTAQTRSHNKQNEITSVSGATTPTFDANGNMTKDETGRQFVFDAWNRIKIVKDSGGTTLKTYKYDAMNRRVSETVGSNTTDLYYSTGWQVLEERVNGTGKYRYVWSPVYVDAMILRDRLDATERIWVQQDANFNVTAITDNSGVVLERYVYDSYGKVTVLNASWTAISSSAYAWQYLHQGGRLDAVSALYHFRNRDFSPTLGRWTSVDPLGYHSRDVNFYAYENSAPTYLLDPSGLIVKEIVQDGLIAAYEAVKRQNVVSIERKLRFGASGWAEIGGKVTFLGRREVQPQCPICASITVSGSGYSQGKIPNPIPYVNRVFNYIVAEGSAGISGKVLICPAGAAQLQGKPTFAIGMGLVGSGKVTGTVAIKGGFRKEIGIELGKAYVEIGIVFSRTWTILPDDGSPSKFNITGYANATVEFGIGWFKRGYKYEFRIGGEFDL